MLTHLPHDQSNAAELMSELWRGTVVPGYEVSSHGRVRSLDRETVGTNGRITRWKGRVLKFSYSKGYALVRLCHQCKCKTWGVHQLVAKAFLPDPGPAPVDGWSVDHIDEVKTNNHYTNLQWLPRGENVSKSTRGVIRGPRVTTTTKPMYD